MSYILTDISNNLVTYPYSIGLLRRDNPSTSFPASPTNAQLAEWLVYPVTEVSQPTFDTLLEYVTEGTPVYSDDEWTQVWVVNTYTTEEQADVLLQFQESAAQTAASLFEQTNKFITQSLTEGLELHQDLIDYRSALADPTSLPGYPNNTTFPTYPTSIFVGAGATKIAAIDVETITITGTLTIGSTPLNNDSVATKAYVDNAITELVDSSPTTLNTLNELAAALGDDANFATTVATQLGSKANSADVNLALSTKANTTYVDTELGTKLSVAGDAMSGQLDMGSNGIIRLATPQLSQDAANKQYVDDAINVGDLIATFEEALT